MRRTLIFGLLCVALLVFIASCSQEPPVAPETTQTDATAAAFSVDPQQIAEALVARSGWQSEEVGGTDVAAVPPFFGSFQRTVIAGDVAHYTCEIQVGPGMHDRIGLHRVVRESQPYKPIHTRKAVFLQHGDLIGFTKFIFGAAAPSLPDDYSVAAFLAENGVDVWGIDQNWVLVPGGTTDFSFMAGWGLQNQVDNLGVGLGVARFARAITGNGMDKMLLLGYSSGIFTGYALLNEESQRPPGLRQVKGYIPVDFGYVDAEGAATWCEWADYYQGNVDAGNYQEDLSVFAFVADLAETAPNDPSPIPDFAGLTNLQVALAFGTFAAPPPDWFHYVAGVFDPGTGLPTDLVATQVPAWLDFLQTAAYVEAEQFLADYTTILCNQVDLPFDDHLGEVTVPVFYVGAAGGGGVVGLESLALLGSTDVSSMIVHLTPPTELPLEFGHIDLWTADKMPNNAETKVWTPILEWINSHSQRDRDHGMFVHN